jgi:hypothetical protein
MAAHVSLLETSLSRQLHWISAADAKTAPVLAIDTAMLASLAAFAPGATKWEPLMLLLALVSVVLVSCSLFFVVATQFPRTRSPKRSLIFFGDITTHSFEAYRAACQAWTEDQYVEDLIAQTYRNAEIAGEKFRNAKAATFAMAAAFLPWLLAIYMMFPLDH